MEGFAVAIKITTVPQIGKLIKQANCFSLIFYNFKLRDSSQTDGVVLDANRNEF